MIPTIIYLFIITVVTVCTNKISENEGLRVGILSEFSICGLLFVLLEQNVLFSIILGFTAVAAQMDKKTKTVYDWLSIIPIIISLFVIFVPMEKPAIDIFILAPLLFTVLTFFARGFADTLFMILFALWGIKYSDPFVMLMCFLTAYLIQLLIKVRKCIREHRPYREKLDPEQALPFMPSLFYGFAVINIIYHFI